MKKAFSGTIVRFGEPGVGVVDVAGLPDYVYFRPQDIENYKGETLVELARGAGKRWRPGSVVVLDADQDASGYVKVKSVSLK